MTTIIGSGTLPVLEGYRSGHNGAVLKTVRGKLHAGSNPAPSATKETTFVYRTNVVYFNEVAPSELMKQNENASLMKE